MVKFFQFHAEETNMWVERSTVFMISILRIHIFQSGLDTTNYILQALLKRMSKTPVASGLQINVFSGSQIEPCKSWKIQDLIWRGLVIHSIFAKQATFVSFWFVYPHFDSTKEFGGPTHHLLDDGWSLVIVTFWMVKHRWKKATSATMIQPKNAMLCLIRAFLSLKQIRQSCWPLKTHGKEGFLVNGSF